MSNLHYERDLLGEVIDYTLCGYVGELVICNTDCGSCTEDDKILNKEHFKQKYANEGTVLHPKANIRKARKI